MSVDRGERSAQEFLTAALRHGTALPTTHPVVGQVWRNRSQQARLARFLQSVTIHRLDDGLAVGVLLGRSGTFDIVDAHLVTVAVELSEPILTGNVDDIALLVASIPNNHPRIHRWR